MGTRRRLGDALRTLKTRRAIHPAGFFCALSALPDVPPALHPAALSALPDVPPARCFTGSPGYRVILLPPLDMDARPPRAAPGADQRVLGPCFLQTFL